MWLKADVNYTAPSDFIAENKEKYLVKAYFKNRKPVIVYVSLYDINGNECAWLKGGHYTAKFHYGSVFPGQKMKLMRHLDHDSLVEVLFHSFETLSTTCVAPFLHKDLDFRSVNLAEPMLTREEYLQRTEQINANIRKKGTDCMKPILIHNKAEGSVIELHYKEGDVYIIKAETNGGFITAIKIDEK